MAKNSLFRPMDAVFPIGSGVVGLGLGIWGLVAAPNTAAKLISLATGLVFAAFVPILYLWRRSARKHDFDVHGVLVRLGKKHRPTREQLSQWIMDCVDLYAKHYDRAKVLNAIEGVLLVYVDVLKMGKPGMWMAGYSTDNAAVVGYKAGDWGRSRSLTIHELGHHVLGGVEPSLPWENEAHHRKMGQLGIGH